MLQLQSNITWITRGSQKSAVAHALHRPMTPSEIWHAARSHNHRIQLRDVWFILRQATYRGLVQCFSRKEVTGKVYYWTDQGRAVLRSAFGIALSPRPRGITWAHVSYVLRSKMRRLVLLELAILRFIETEGAAATRIRRRLNERRPACLNSVIRALQELRDCDLVEIAGEGSKRGQKLYRLTPEGQRISALLQTESYLNRLSMDF